MSRKIDARTSAVDAAERLFRIQGYAATGLNQIINESGSPKGSFYFHFPRGKMQLAEEAVDQYIAGRVAAVGQISAGTPGDAHNFVKQLFEAVATEMIATDFRYGCLMQNLANELSTLDSELARRIACGFATLTDMVVKHLEKCGMPAARAATAAASLAAAFEGARTIARLQRTTAVYAALADISMCTISACVGPTPFEDSTPARP